MSIRSEKLAAKIATLQAEFEEAQKAERDQILTLVNRAAERSGLVDVVVETNASPKKLADIFRRVASELKAPGTSPAPTAARAKEEVERESSAALGEAQGRRGGFFGGSK